MDNRTEKGLFWPVSSWSPSPSVEKKFQKMWKIIPYLDAYSVG